MLAVCSSVHHVHINSPGRPPLLSPAGRPCSAGGPVEALCGHCGGRCQHISPGFLASVFLFFHLSACQVFLPLVNNAVIYENCSLSLSFFLSLSLSGLPLQALSGDSSINPALGRLVLQCLCPALRTLLSDGLKPHQSDLIAGRRPNSPWGLVQASTKPGQHKGQTCFGITVLQ